LQGSRLHAALDRTELLFSGQPEESSRSVLLITDGDFDESGLEERVAELAKKDIQLHVMGIGTQAGGPVPSPQGGSLRDARGQTIHSKLNNELLERLAIAGTGQYIKADFRDHDSRHILDLSSSGGIAKAADNTKTLVWNERYYLLLLPLMLILLHRYRKSWPGKESE